MPVTHDDAMRLLRRFKGIGDYIHANKMEKDFLWDKYLEMLYQDADTFFQRYHEQTSPQTEIPDPLANHAVLGPGTPNVQTEGAPFIRPPGGEMED